MTEHELLRLADTSAAKETAEVGPERQDDLGVLLLRLYANLTDYINPRLRELCADQSISEDAIMGYAESLVEDLNREFPVGGAEVDIVGTVLLPVISDIEGNSYKIDLAEQDVDRNAVLHSLALIRSTKDESGDRAGPQIGIKFAYGEAGIPYFDGKIYGMAELTKIKIIDLKSIDHEAKPEEIDKAINDANIVLEAIREVIEANGGVVSQGHYEKAMRLLSDLYSMMPSTVGNTKIYIEGGSVTHMYLYDRSDHSIHRRNPRLNKPKIQLEKLEVIGFKLPAELDPTLLGVPRQDDTNLKDGIGLYVKYDDDQQAVAILPSASITGAELSID